jgi:hypothetical protein
MLRALLTLPAMISRYHWALILNDVVVSDICLRVIETERPTYTTLNGFIGQVLAFLTGSL